MYRWRGSGSGCTCAGLSFLPGRQKGVGRECLVIPANPRLEKGLQHKGRARLHLGWVPLRAVCPPRVVGGREGSRGLPSYLLFAALEGKARALATKEPGTPAPPAIPSRLAPGGGAHKHPTLHTSNTTVWNQCI